MAFSGGIDSTAVAADGGAGERRDWAAVAIASARSRSTSAAGATPHRLKASCATSVSRRNGNGWWRRRRTCDLEAAIRLIEDYHPLDVECAAAAAVPAARHPRALPASAIPARRRRRRREPQVVSARGLGPDALQHSAQPAALSGGMGRGRDQAQPRLLGRPVAQLRADVCAGVHARVPRVLSVHHAIGDRVGCGDPVRAGARRATPAG